MKSIGWRSAARPAFAVVAAALFAAGCSQIELPDAAIEKGGPAFDFAACSRAAFPMPDAAAPGNLARAKFPKPLDAVLEATAKTPLPSRTLAAEDVALAQTNGGFYRVSFRYRYVHADDKGYTCATVDGTTVRLKQRMDVWNDFAREFPAKPGQTKIHIRFWQRGAGEMHVKDVSVVPMSFADPVTIWLAPHGLLGGEFYLSKGQPALMSFEWRKNDPAFKMWNEPTSFTLELPPGVEYVDAAFARPGKVVKKARADGGTTVAIPAAPGYAPSTARNYWTQLVVMLKTDRDAGTLGEAAFTAHFKGKKVSNVVRPVLKAMPAFPRAQAPARYANGLMTGGAQFDFADPAAQAEVARLFGEAGVGWVVGGAKPEVRDLWRKRGVRYVTPGGYYVANGFRVGDWRKRPAEDRWVKVDADAKGEIDKATCPVAVYRESAFFRTNTVPRFQKDFAGYDGVWANWEPYSFRGRGCFCDRCREECERYLKLPAGTMKGAWPACVRKGGKYFGREIERFRSWQHAQLVKTVQRVIVEATGGAKSVGFIPGVSWLEAASGWKEENRAPEVQPNDYLEDLRWIDFWGPYVCWEGCDPYVYLKRHPLCHFIGAKDVREELEKHHAKDRIPKLMALPHGVQGGSWYTQPEYLEMSLDSFFFNRWEASVVYYFPRGYDARYWKAFAAATDRAGRYEKYVLDGVRADDATSVKTVPAYAAPCKEVCAFIAKWKNESLLQTAAFEKDGARIVAALNFWDQGEAFFDLACARLPAGDYAIVASDGTLRAKDRRHATWSARELAAGVRLVVPATRTVVFEIRPAARGWADATRVLTNDALDALYHERLPALERAAAEDAAYEKANGYPIGDMMPNI